MVTESCVLKANGVFTAEEDELGMVTDVQHWIETRDHSPAQVH